MSAAALELPATPDFDTWPVDTPVDHVAHQDRVLTVTWQDGRVSRYHSVWLRENAADQTTVNPKTRERVLDLSQLADWPTLTAAWLEDSGAVSIRFAPEQHTLSFHPGWLRANDYSHLEDPDAPLVPTRHWTAETRSDPISLDAGRWLQHTDGDPASDALLGQALEAVIGEGLVRLRNLPTVPGTLDAIAARLGVLRPTNFGSLFDVRAKPDPDSNAYTSIALPPHVDLPTREYQPGLQLLHCLENSAVGGQAVMMDGFAVAETLRARHPEHFDTLTRVRWCFANTAKTSDHVWFEPMIKCDPSGRVTEIRVADFLRGPLQAPFEDIEPAYAALICLQTLLKEPQFALRFTYAPGDLVIFDNRRLLHGRDAFDPGTGGSRWLQGCYLERDEIRSRLRMIRRAERERQVEASG
ncbi:TauD/TfdA family dioxygenase [Salinisphaera sp. SPP-AMP-43]|uniref:TauD/TfdA family dioxygenase n=1 Tax=Salinisphaera sp. SPP-AMP-43 TaxID=3121288 RepID=UPI003C6DBBE3